MLGKDHIGISIAFIIPFLIPLLFTDSEYVIFFVTLMISVFVGSLIPDSDCGGKATIYYKFPIVDFFMKKVVGKLIVFMFSILVSKKKISVEYKVGDEHRGIIHSPIGVLITSILIIIPISLFSLFFDMFVFEIQLAIFLGLLIGQFLHLFQDSCTISGINWKFPFGTYRIRGNICTFQKNPKLKDIRPLFFASILHFLSLILILIFVFDFFVLLKFFWIYFIIVFYEIISIFIIIKISKSKEHFWLVARKTESRCRRKLKEIIPV